MTGERVDLFEALTDCADELEGEIVARYVHADGVHPAMQHKYDRDMQTVIDARTAITALRAQVAALAGEKAATGRRLDAAEGVVKAALAWYEIPGSWDDEAAWLSQACDEWKRVCAEVDAARGGEG